MSASGSNGGGSGGGAAARGYVANTHGSHTISVSTGFVLLAVIVVLLAVMGRHNQNLEITQNDVFFLRRQRDQCEAELKRYQQEFQDNEHESRKCLVEKDYLTETRYDLEDKLDGAVRGKMDALEDKLELLEQNRASEERLINTLAHVQLLKKESANKDQLLKARDREYELAQEEVHLLKIELLQMKLDKKEQEEKELLKAREEEQLSEAREEEQLSKASDKEQLSKNYKEEQLVQEKQLSKVEEEEQMLKDCKEKEQLSEARECEQLSEAREGEQLLEAREGEQLSKPSEEEQLAQEEQMSKVRQDRQLPKVRKEEQLSEAREEDQPIKAGY